MKKMLFAAAAALTALAGCQKNEIAAPSAEDAVLYATIEENAASRTYMDASNNIRWSEGDQVAAFIKVSYGVRYQVNPSFVGKTYAEFSIVPSDKVNDDYGVPEWDHNVAYYPYSDDVKASGAMDAVRSESSYTLNVVLPSEQTYVPDSFGEGAMAMVAVSEDKNFTFRNVLGGMKLQLKGTQTVTSISLEGGNSEKLSGAATVKAYAGATKPKISMSDAASGAVTLNCGSGVQLNESTATVFIIALPPVTFSQGFTVTVTDSDGKTYTVETDKSNEVIRSSLLVMPPVTLGASDEDEPEISGSDYIDEYGINHGKGIEIDGVVWAPVNCGYHATDFKYGKLYQWGRKYGQGYSGNLYDVNGKETGTYSDASVPTIEEGGVSVITGNHKSKENIFYTGTSSYYYDWADPQDGRLWNFGTDYNPVKTEYDPCPEGWRVPTYAELNELCKNRSAWTSEDDQPGYWFSGASSYTDEVPQVFFPAAGYRDCIVEFADSRGYYGCYWSSIPYDSGASFLYFFSSTLMTSDARAVGYSVRCVQDDKELIPVSSLTLDEISLLLNEGETATLSATISPSDANHQSAYWYSENPSIATVDQNGMVTAVVAGTTNIIAVAGMQTAACEVIVKEPSQDGDYVDEYGINRGQGIKIGETVWAPVNCGYHETDFKYGKLYQWGRKYGQGYSGTLCDLNGIKIGTYSDSSVPTIVSGPVTLSTGQSKSNEEYFYQATTSSKDWLSPQNVKLWNSGTEDHPVKTEYDPCPDGWRVPTYAELDELCKNRSDWKLEADQPGYWFSGASLYTDEVSQVFFSAAGGRYYDGRIGTDRGFSGNYWSSGTYSNGAHYLSFYDFIPTVEMGYDSRAVGFSVRCVQVTD